MPKPPKKIMYRGKKKIETLKALVALNFNVKQCVNVFQKKLLITLKYLRFFGSIFIMFRKLINQDLVGHGWWILRKIYFLLII